MIRVQALSWLCSSPRLVIGHFRLSVVLLLKREAWRGLSNTNFMRFLAGSLLSCALVSAVTAVQLDLIGRRVGYSSLYRRDDAGQFGNGSHALSNNADILYFTNITVGGRQFTVVIDTGSSDLWVSGDVPGALNLTNPAIVTLPFAKGQVNGFINTVEVQYDGFTIQDQAFINAFDVEDIGLQIDGIIGLGPSANSNLKRKVGGDPRADPPLDRIFQENPNTPNFMTLLLSRNTTLEGTSVHTWPAQLAIGAVAPGLESIQGMPKLPALVDQFGIQHWQTLLDENGIAVNGQRISTKTSIQNPTAGTPNQIHVALDSGFSIAQVPKYVADAMYSDVPGAKFIQDGATELGQAFAGIVNFWCLPCEAEVNVSFFFGGNEYPVSPLDLNVPVGKDPNGQEVCIAYYQQISDSLLQNQADFGAFDMILGPAFLRNVYTLINFGNFVGGSTSNVAPPFIQLLSIADKNQMHQDFVSARLNGGQNGGQSPTDNASPADPGSGSSSHDDNGSPSHLPGILGLSLGLSVLVYMLGF
ncbi:hypothetical protein D9758_002624 [Tetrapyrgos nigripes]|uniref:Peptidase A1 domain-containing protein n=1 Tax=Tetrapyrgos nigripes TaxID=182062 RepID=A0A8H5LU34_9AGAR|nr:hypothetical protein D9758_002624 [Tetrapyrgos nigripes]